MLVNQMGWLKLALIRDIWPLKKMVILVELEEEVVYVGLEQFIIVQFLIIGPFMCIDVSHSLLFSQ
jgi:hypothetical protein